MKNALRTHVLAALACVSTAGAANFEIRQGHYLWHEWESIYKASWSACPERPDGKRLDWTSFERMTAAWNSEIKNVGDFRKLPAGTVIEIPPSPCDIQAAERENAQLKAQMSGYQTALTKANEDLRALRSDLGETNALLTGAATLAAWFRNPWTWLALAVFAIALALAMALLLKRRRHPDPALYVARDDLSATHVAREDYDRLLQEKAKLENDLHISNHFLGLYAHRYALRQGLWFPHKGKRYEYMYLPRVDDRTVRIHGIPDPVLIDNVNQKLWDADDATLRYYGIERDFDTTRRSGTAYTKRQT